MNQIVKQRHSISVTHAFAALVVSFFTPKTTKVRMLLCRPCLPAGVCGWGLSVSAGHLCPVGPKTVSRFPNTSANTVQLPVTISSKIAVRWFWNRSGAFFWNVLFKLSWTLTRLITNLQFNIFCARLPFQMMFSNSRCPANPAAVINTYSQNFYQAIAHYSIVIPIFLPSNAGGAKMPLRGAHRGWPPSYCCGFYPSTQQRRCNTITASCHRCACLMCLGAPIKNQTPLYH